MTDGVIRREGLSLMPLDYALELAGVEHEFVSNTVRRRRPPPPPARSSLPQRQQQRPLEQHFSSSSSSSYHVQHQSQSPETCAMAGLHVDIQLANESAGTESAPLSSALSCISSGRESLASSADTSLRMASGVRSDERLSSGAETEAEGSRASRCSSAYSTCPSVDSAMDLASTRGVAALCPELLLPAAELLCAPEAEETLSASVSESVSDECSDYDAGTLTRESKRKHQRREAAAAPTPPASLTSSEYAMCSTASEPELALASDDQYATVIRTHRRNLTTDETILPAHQLLQSSPRESTQQRAENEPQSRQLSNPSQTVVSQESAYKHQKSVAGVEAKPHSDRSRRLTHSIHLAGRSLSAPGHRLVRDACETPAYYFTAGGSPTIASLSSAANRKSRRPLITRSPSQFYSWPRTLLMSIPLPIERRLTRRFPPPLPTSQEPTSRERETELVSVPSVLPYAAASASVPAAAIGEASTPPPSSQTSLERSQRLSALLTMHSSFCADLWSSTPAERNRVFWPVNAQQASGSGAWAVSMRAVATGKSVHERLLPVPVLMPQPRAAQLAPDWQFVARGRPQLSLPGPYPLLHAHTMPPPGSPGARH